MLVGAKDKKKFSEPVCCYLLIDFFHYTKGGISTILFSTQHFQTLQKRRSQYSSDAIRQFKRKEVYKKQFTDDLLVSEIAYIFKHVGLLHRKFDTNLGRT